MNIRNPRTGQYDYTITPPSATAVAALAAQLRQEQQAWQQGGIEYRIAAMQQWKQVVVAHKSALVDALCTDTGRHWETVLEADLVATAIDRWCGIARDFCQPVPRKTASIPFLQLQQELVPYPLVSVISPWNFPLLLSLIDTIPALLAGSAVLVKPSEVTPRFIRVMAATIAEVPALHGIFRYIEGDGAVGAAMVATSDLVCFTGSTATGKKVYDAAAKAMIPVFLEMGGKDPAIVLEGADLDLATSSILWGGTANAGQSCLSIERIYVQDTIHDAFVQLLAQKAAQVRLNDGDIHNGQIGPLIFGRQAEIINDHLQDALSKGATLVYGDARCRTINGGSYCHPTILTHVHHGMKVMTEETFGPILPVMAFHAKEDAIALANGTRYGLSGAVFAADTATAMELAAQVEGGAISINDCALTAVMHEGEKNSFKLSGIGGTRMGPAAIKRFMRQKVFIIKEGDAPSPWWYDA